MSKFMPVSNTYSYPPGIDMISNRYAQGNCAGLPLVSLINNYYTISNKYKQCTRNGQTIDAPTHIVKKSWYL